MKKYGIDILGNLYIGEATQEPVGMTWTLNPNRETFVQPPEVPEGKRLSLADGSDIFNKNWILIDIPPENIFDSELKFIRPKNQTERIISGIDPTPAGIEVSDGKLVAMTLEGQLTAQQITQTQYRILKNSPVMNVLQQIDTQSVRSIREYLITLSSCPDILKTHEQSAQTARATLLK